MAVQNTIKITLEFTAGRASWSESFALLNADANRLDTYQGVVNQLCLLRAGLLGNGAFLPRVRISVLPANRQVDDLLFEPTPLTGSWPADPGGLVYNSAIPNVAMLVQLANTLGHFRNYYIAGCPCGVFHLSSISPNGLNFGAGGGFYDNATRYLNYLTSGQFGWISTTATLLNYQQVQNPLAISAVFPNSIGLTVPLQFLPVGVPGNIAVGVKLKVEGFRRVCTNQPPLNGLWSVAGIVAPVAPATSWTYFLLNSNQVPTNNYKNMGKVAVFDQFAEQFANGQWSIIGATTRKRGGRLEAPVGRRSKTAF